MSKEVRGEAEGVTLVDVIRRGDILHPGRVSRPVWNKWRANEGRRPTKERDGFGVSKEDESRIYREVMELLNDPEIARGVEERKRAATEAEEAEESGGADEEDEETGGAAASSEVPATSKARGKGKGTRSSTSAATGEDGDGGHGLAYEQPVGPTVPSAAAEQERVEATSRAANQGGHGGVGEFAQSPEPNAQGGIPERKPGTVTNGMKNGVKTSTPQKSGRNMKELKKKSAPEAQATPEEAGPRWK